jgi:hypothetical protein
MKKLGISAIVAGGIGAAVVGLGAPAYAAPAGSAGSHGTTAQIAPASANPSARDDQRITSHVAYLVSN